MSRYVLTVQYSGKNYAGSQIQIKLKDLTQPVPTVQGELEKAICTLQGITNETLINKRPIKTIFSGRTDAGVDARGQVVHFDLEKNLVASDFIRRLNALLPDDISVSDLRVETNEFHAQKSAKMRTYQYILINREIKNAFDGDLMRVVKPLNIEKLKEALKYLEGEHDFSAFRNSGTLNPYTDCTLTKATCERRGDFIIFDFEGNRFLYNMIRIIIGTLLMIEGKGLEARVMKEILDSGNRKLAGRTVNPYGLTLVKVEY